MSFATARRKEFRLETPENSRRLAPIPDGVRHDLIPEDCVTLASEICGVPIALLSTVDRNRLLFSAAIGIDSAESEREQAFCSYVLLEPEMQVVSDVWEDPRFAGNPLIAADPPIRFFAGAPLLSQEGYALGTLCALDRQPKRLSPSQLSSFDALSRSVAAMLDARRLSRSLAQANEALACDLRGHQKSEQQANVLIRALQGDESGLKILRGLLSMCSYCKSIRDEEGEWRRLEACITLNPEARFSHGICPDCLDRELEGLGLA